MAFGLLVALTLAPTPFRLVSAPNGAVELVQRKRRLRLPPVEAPVVATWPGASLRDEGGKLVYRGKGGTRTFDPKRDLEFWLVNDDLWGGHAAANAQRYTDSRGGGFAPEVHELLAQPDGSALGVVTLRIPYMSGEPLGPQVLFRFRPGAERLEAVRVLSSAGAPWNGTAPRRIFRIGGRQLVQDGDLNELRPDGALGKTVQKLPPASVSLAVAGGRWILIGSESSRSYEAYDGRTGRLSTLPPLWGVDTGYVAFAGVSADAPYALFWTYGKSDCATVVCLTDGKRTAFDGLPNCLWGEVSVDTNNDVVSVWSNATGKLLARLRKPGI